MFRMLFLSAVCLISVPVSAAEKPFKNKSARDAQDEYRVTIAKTKADYLAKLEIAIKKAGSEGDIDEANQLVAEKKSVEEEGAVTDEVAKFRKNFIGKVWKTGPKTWIRFDKDGKGVNQDRIKLVWATLNKSLIHQNYKSSKVFIWQFDKNIRTTKITEFIKSKRTFDGTLRTSPKRK